MSVSHASRIAALSLAVAGFASSPTAQQPSVGAPAPAIDCSSWLNTDAAPPMLESLRGRVVMLEFWGTWCGPCVRSMPEVQKLHDRYRERGLTVVAISREAPGEMTPFLEEHGYTMLVGSDPEKKVIGAYGVRSWPTTVVVGKDGNVAWIGSPYGAEAAIEKALGLESSPATLLTTWLDAMASGEQANREALTRLREKATADFDLRAWARANGGAEAAIPADAAAGDGAAVEVREASAGGATEAMPPEAAAKLLEVCIDEWSEAKPDQRTDALRRLGDAAPGAFDLAAWVRERFAEAFPLDAKELKALLDDERFADAVQELVARRPPGKIVALAARHEGLERWCEGKSAAARELAKKALMAQCWVFAGVPPKDNDAFWRELAISGVSTSKDRKQILGVLLGGATVTRSMAGTFAHDQLATAIVMDALASGKPPRLDQLGRTVESERAALMKDLERRHGELPTEQGREK